MMDPNQEAARYKAEAHLLTRERDSLAAQLELAENNLKHIARNPHARKGWAAEVAERYFRLVNGDFS